MSFVISLVDLCLRLCLLTCYLARECHLPVHQHIIILFSNSIYMVTNGDSVVIPELGMLLSSPESLGY